MTKTRLFVVVVVTAIALLSVVSYAGVEEKLSILTAESDTNPQLTIDVPTSKTIRIVNNTGFPIYYLYVSPSASTEWGDDLLSIIETISNGEQYDTGIVADSTRYDIKCVDSEGYSFYKWDVDVSKSNIVEFTILDMDISEHASRETVKISNNTGYPIYHIYVSPTTDTEWGEDLLSATEIIGDGEEYDTGIYVDSTRYDIKLIDNEGDSYTKWDVGVSESSTVQFTLLDIDPDTSSTDSTPVTVFNGTGYQIQEVYISPADSDSWGPNRLSAGTSIPDRGSFYANLSGSQTVYDFKLVDIDGDQYVKWNVDTSSGEWVIFALSDLVPQTLP